MKRTSPMPSSAADVMTKTSSPATAVNIIKLQQFIALMAVIVAVNCLKINLIPTAAALTEEEAVEKRTNDIRTKCFKIANVTEEQKNLILDHKLVTAKTTLATTPKAVQCYSLCYLTENTIFVQDKINEKMLRNTLPLMINDAKKANAVLDKCLKLVGADKCEMAFGFTLCLTQSTGLYM